MPRQQPTKRPTPKKKGSVDVDLLRQKFREWTAEERLAYVQSLSKEAAEQLKYCSELWLRDKQIPPQGDWRYCFVVAGRFFGKTKMGACWIKKQVEDDAKGIAIIGPTHRDVSQTMVPAIMAEYPPDEQPTYSENRGTLGFHHRACKDWNCIGCRKVVFCYSADTEIRGPNIEKCWCDEICKWNDSLEDKVRESWRIMNFAVRVGKRPQILVTTTPKSWEMMKEWERRFKEGDSLITMVRGSGRENDAVPESAHQALEAEYGTSRFGRQELLGDILTDTEGALWNWELFQYVKNPPQLHRVVVAIDPATTAKRGSDLTGVIVAGLGVDGHVYILDDATGRYTPEQWAKKAVNKYRQWGASCIVAESNQGGELVRTNIRIIAPLKVELVHASQSKMMRLEPVSSLYEQKRVFHVGEFKELEDQLCSYNGDPRAKSPDRADALAYAVHELLLKRNKIYRSTQNIPYL